MRPFYWTGVFILLRKGTREKVAKIDLSLAERVKL